MYKITENPYFSKVVLTILVVVVKLGIDSITKEKEEAKGFIKLFAFFVYYFLPIIIITWLNLDNQVENNKLTSTIIAFNIGLIIFNFLQTRITEISKMLADLAKAEFDKVEKVKQINETQVEKIKAINENQKYILNELSKINDRIIGYFKDKSK